MGLFDLFSRGKSEAPRASERELLRLERLIGNKLSQDPDRQEAIETLCKLGTAGAAAALLKRFNWQLDPSITDQEEKERCLRGIVEIGEPALDAVRAYCKRAESLMWPLRVLKGVLTGPALTQELLGLLEQFDTEYVRNVEPKVQLITELADHGGDDVRAALEPFLDDASEPVRFTTVTSLFALGDAQSVPPLVACMAAEESRRVKNRIAEGLASRGFELPESLRDTCRGALPEGFALDGAKVVKR